MSPPRQLVVEADGGSRGNPGVAGYGALVREVHSGAVLAERAAPLGRQSNNVAEYSGLIAGLEAAAALDPGAEVEVRMDSKLVIEQMAGRWKIKHPDMRRLASAAAALVQERQRAGGAVSWTWIPRAQNSAADELSNTGMDGHTVERDLWRQDAPQHPPTPGGPAVEHVGEQVLSTDQSPAAPPDAGSPVRVLLVRHGVSAFTEQWRLDGRGGADPGLAPAGRDQAARAAATVSALVAEVDSVAVITSSLRRARETGAILAAAISVTPQVDADWDEQSFGVWDGLSIHEIEERFPGQLARMRAGGRFAPEGGESHQDLITRVPAALARALDRVGPGGTVVVATHRKPIMAVLAQLLELDPIPAWRLAIAPGSVTGLEIWPDGSREASVAFTNDTQDRR